MTDKERLDFLQANPELREAIHIALWEAGCRMRIKGDVRLAIDDAANATMNPQNRERDGQHG